MIGTSASRQRNATHRNGASRILDAENRIVKIVNNYAGINFNFGPTLLSWLAEKVPETYRDILAADRASTQRFSGQRLRHGPMLQPHDRAARECARQASRRCSGAFGTFATASAANRKA